MPKKDEANVQAEAVSQETESKEEEKPETLETPPAQPLTEERIQQIIAEQTERAKREIQSIKDRSRAEIEVAQRRARIAEDTLTGIHQGGFGEEPEQAELKMLKAERMARQRADAEEQQRQYTQAVERSFNDQMTQFITSTGLNPSDKRIDWGEDVHTGDLLTKQQRILSSVAKVQKEDAHTANERRSQELKDVEARLRKDLGIDSVDTSASGGAVEAGGFAKIEQAYTEGNITYEEYKKARKKYNIGG